jgi:hypothetical protein
VLTANLAARYVCSYDPSPRSRCAVGGLAAFAVLAPYHWPTFLPFAGAVAILCLFLQFALSLYLVLHHIWHETERAQFLLLWGRPLAYPTYKITPPRFR